MTDLLFNIKHFLVSIFWGLIASIKAIYANGLNFIKHIKSLPIKLANLTDTNLELADFHLRNGNISDAILRLKITKNLIAPNNKQIEYKLAWCYFIKDEIQQAILHLDKCLDITQAAELKNLLSSNDIAEIPSAILQQYKDFSAVNWEDKFIDKKCNVYQEVIRALALQMKNIQPGCEILDFGAYNGAIGKEIARQLPNKYSIDAVENCPRMHKFLLQSNIYHNIYNVSLLDFLDAKNKPYDIIFTLASLSFIKNFTFYLKGLRQRLKQGGYLALVLPINACAQIASNKIEFLYNEEEVSQILRELGFKSINSKALQMSNEKVYNIWICEIN